MDPPLGAIVEVSAGRGTVRFCGATAFSPGKWIGIELAEPNGKNNGTVNGDVYFNCKMNYGVFVRPSQVKVISTEPEAPPAIRLPIAAPRPSLGHQRTASTGISRTNSVRSSSSVASSSRSASPAKPSGSSLAPAATPSNRNSRFIQPTPARPQSLSLGPRKSLLRHSPANDNGTPLSPSIATSRRLESPTRPAVVSPIAERHATRILSPPAHIATSNGHISPPLSTLPLSAQKPPSRPPSPAETHPQPQAQIKPQDDQELQELRAKIRVLEAKRADDARHVRELETRLSEAESFVALRPKLQAKLNSQQTDLIATRRELADAQQLSQLSESRLLDSQEQLEMAMLDKEVAEEKAEIMEAELEEVKEKLAVAEVELEAVKEDGAAAADTDVNAKDSLAYIQLEKQNERLKEALIRLRDLTQETEQEQRRRISEMEKDMTGIDDLQSQYDSTLIKLSNADVQIEDLKLQLDDALGAEEMLVQLTERNLMLGEKIEEMRITIEDLEALKELNDELEENHVETEKAMQNDLETKDMQLRESARKVEGLEEVCMDMEGTIGQFRELVMQLQSELDNLRTQTQMAQHESATAVSQTAAMMSINLKLQSSAVKNQAKHIELEIKKLEARETRELLGIVQPYLPQLYVESDSDATSCYLFLQRLAYKTDLISTVVAQAHGLPESLNGPVSEILVGVCEMRGRISGLSILCRRFAAILRRCDVESFLSIGRIYPEIAPMEKRIDLHIDLLRRDEFREMECVSDIVKMQAQFDHLTETYFSGFEHDLGERELGYALSCDNDLDVFAAAIGLTKTSIDAVVQDPDAAVEMGGMDIDEELFGPLQSLLDRCKSAKSVSKKLAKRLEDLIQDSSALKSHMLPKLKELSNLVPELTNFGISLAQLIMPHLSDVRSSKSPFQLTKVLALVKQVGISTVAKHLKPGKSPYDAVLESISLLIEDSGRLLPLTMEAENVVKITGRSPWVTRVDEIKASLAVNVEAERKVAQLNDEMQGLVRSLRTKDQSIQESVVKIELMERRMEAVRKQADTISDLETELSKARKQERAYEEAMEQLQADLDGLEQDNAKLKKIVTEHEPKASTANQVDTESIPQEGSFETSYLLERIDALRGTVRFLRTENSFLKGQDLLKEINALPPLLEPVSRLPTPELDPSGQSDSDDSDADHLRPTPTLRSLTTETKILYRDVIKFSSSPRVVDLSVLNARRAETNSKGGKIWMPKKKTPAYQLLERKMEAERLSRRVRGLLDRTNAIGASH